ncbi:OmpA family protein [Flavobacterium psychrophilum]|uniref:OmpA family protein n=7 Tax=Flavobacterium psychrophilum TaxID=96345 RepID=A0A075SKH9_FLAPS|nr:OmpA family protein [Flavobacterium psychrophilum]AIG30280.1 membrane protein [Flavobacterium psychrophilum]AIG32556.1 membrane protein [Flavobacterium psychrophilum]AIG34711.1 membrane protein [Flavobacterium psychrophilum]AIG37076.1 membrane protein [Flavobacterium psychrophilum]AIG39340.1 membrane protein [Flavobacterium psychrophilum]
MKKSIIYMLSLSFLLGTVLSSCDAIKNSNNTQRGATGGAVLGAVLGGVLGNNIGHGGNGALGAVLGGVIGGVAGGVIGNKMDKQARKISESLPGAKVERVGEGIRLVLGENAIRFDTNKSTLTASAKANLDKLVKVFTEYPDTDIQIYGYTDSSGADDYNLKLSEQRAASVKTYLSAKGLASTRFNTSGLGEADPIAPNETADGKSQNRRVEFAITANDKMVNDAKKESGN